MPITSKRHRRLAAGGGAIALGVLTLWVAVAQAAGPPLLGATFTSAVQSSTARLQAQVNPNALSTSYHFDYLTKVAYEANVAAAKDPFAGAKRVPPIADASVGSGTAQMTVLQIVSLLTPSTAYRYRVVAKNSAGTVTGGALSFTTQSTGGGSILADGRGWEMVSPAAKNGGQVDAPETLAGGGVLQAAAQGGSVTYGSAVSFGTGAQGAPPASQYIATRTPGGWSSENITVPIFSGTFNAADEGVPYQRFSTDLARGLLLNGDHCRGEATGCAVANPPLGGAPAGYQNYYLRDSSSGSLTPLISSADASGLPLGPADFDLRLAGATADLEHSVLSSCAALTPNATEVPLGEGCDPDETNLYEYSPGTGLSLVNLLPAQGEGTPGAVLGAQSGAISTDGSRVYWNDLATGDLYLRTPGQTKLVGEEATFETASDDGSVAFFIVGGHLWRYLTSSGVATDLTPSGGVIGVLGASADGGYLYFQDDTGLRLWHAGVTSTLAPGANATDASDYPPTTGTARVSADGTRLLFVSTAQLSGYDNTDLNTGLPDSQVYLYDAAAEGLTCVSCNPTNQRPIGPSSIPGSLANGSVEGSTDSYKPRVLSAGGRRVFFDSRDALVLTDTNNDQDAYQWEAQGEGSCAAPGGCVSLISSGRSTEGAIFIDASADGSDAFFLTDGSLVGTDAGARDLYDARVGGGFSEPIPVLSCEGDNCQVLPPEPQDPTLTTLQSGPGNPAVSYGKRCRPGFVKRKGKCVKKGEGKSAKGRHKKSGGKR